MRKLNIIGAGGHGKVAADVALACGYEEITFLDKNKGSGRCMGFPVVDDDLSKDGYQEDAFFVAVGNAKVRERIFQELKERGLTIVTLIHPGAVLGSDVVIGKGSIVMAGVVMNADASIGEGCIINTSSSVDHDNVLADFVHVSVGAHLAGTVKVGKGAWIGAGAVVSNNISICREALVGAGAVVVCDITEPGTYIGVPAKRKEE
jgi:sugar O-acyltransferase (sialic acid O-acetyltransferase NeuD family)